MPKEPVVKIFDPKQDITLTTNASEHSISGILSQEGHQIMYLSRRLTDQCQPFPSQQFLYFCH